MCQFSLLSSISKNFEKVTLEEIATQIEDIHINTDLEKVISSTLHVVAYSNYKMDRNRTP